MNFLSGFIKGLLIGIGAVAPGVSGGALAVILGIYEKLTDAIANVFRDTRRKVIFFFPIAIGGGVGVLGFSRIMQYLFQNYDAQVKYLFIGLMVGTLPSVFKEANKKGFKKIYILPCILAFAATLLSIAFENSGINVISEGEPGVVQYLIYGAIIGFGTIIPGISASFILMYLGAYETLLDAIASINVMVLMPVGLGFAFSIILFAKLINLLFKKMYGYTYYTVLGFVIGSIISIFPGVGLNWGYLVSVLLLITGFYLSFLLSKVAKSS